MVREEDKWNTYGTWNQGIQIGHFEWYGKWKRKQKTIYRIRG